MATSPVAPGAPIKSQSTNGVTGGGVRKPKCARKLDFEKTPKAPFKRRPTASRVSGDEGSVRRKLEF
jgi:hypothetical protein